jgi:ketosteroid isomerase-like protein
MATQPSTEIEFRLAELEIRVRAVEDVQAIRNLKAAYAAYCDDNYNADKIAELFVEDAVWENQNRGRFEGREAIRSMFRTSSEAYTFAVHYSLNPHIEVTGDTARARWYLFMPCTATDGNQALWRGGIDDEEYVRVDGKWMFKSKTATTIFSSLFEESWAKA